MSQMNNDKIIPRNTVLWFEYHCNESHDSPDAPLWYRSHQKVTVLKCCNPEYFKEEKSFIARCDAALVLVYTVRFQDGHVGDVFEDELMSSKKHFDRPNPPKGKLG